MSESPAIWWMDILDMTEFLYSNPCAFPIAVPTKAEDFVFPVDTHRQLLELALPDLKRTAPTRRTPARRSAPSGPRELANPK